GIFLLLFQLGEGDGAPLPLRPADALGLEDLPALEPDLRRARLGLSDAHALWSGLMIGLIAMLAMQAAELPSSARAMHWPTRPIRVRQTYSCVLNRTGRAPAGYPAKVRLALARNEIGRRRTSSIRRAPMLNGNGTTFDP